jgi:hypothetical protein
MQRGRDNRGGGTCSPCLPQRPSRPSPSTPQSQPLHANAVDSNRAQLEVTEAFEPSVTSSTSCILSSAFQSSSPFRVPRFLHNASTPRAARTYLLFLTIIHRAKLFSALHTAIPKLFQNTPVLTIFFYFFFYFFFYCFSTALQAPPPLAPIRATR